MTLAPQRPDRAKRKAIHDRIQADPVWFVEALLGDDMWSKQRDILEALRDHDRVAVRSCHGVGKTFIAARATLWWLACHTKSCAVITTAPTWNQVVEVLWNQIHLAYNGARVEVGGRLLETKLEIADDRFAIGLSPDPHKATNFQGFHAKHLLFIVDEASGVDERIFEAAEGFQTARGAKMLMIGNPTSVSGTFFNAFHKDRADWETIHISALDAPAFTGEECAPDVADHVVGPKWVEEKKQQWGETSPTYQVRVLGEFPQTSDDTIVPLLELDQSMHRHDDGRHPAGGIAYPRTISCDVARFGSDETVIGLRDGDRFQFLDIYKGQALTATAGKIINFAKRYGRNAPLRIVIDDDGLGGGVVDMVREYIYESGLMGRQVAWDVDAFNGGGKPQSPDDYFNRRAEAWGGFAYALRPDDRELVEEDRESHVELPLDDLLRADLLAPKYKLDSKGRIQLEPKDETKKRLNRSPDRGDCVAMAWSMDRGRAVVTESPW